MERRLIGSAGEAPQRRFVNPSFANRQSFRPVHSAPKKSALKDTSANYLDPKLQAQKFNPNFKEPRRPETYTKAVAEPRKVNPPMHNPIKVDQTPEVAPIISKDVRNESTSAKAKIKIKSKDRFKVEKTQANASAVVIDKVFGKFRVFNTQYAFIAAGVLVFVSGLIIALNGFKTNNDVVAQAQNSSQQNTQEGGTSSTDVSEDPSIKNRQHNVAPNEPKRISIPDIKVSAWITAMDVDSSNQLKAPNNIYDTGWYKRSAKPGDKGAMLVDGHVSGPTKPGIFKNIGKLNQGSLIEIERGDGKKFNYRVVETKTYPAGATDMVAAMTSVEPGKPALNLITCSGSFDKESQQYTERTIVFAVLAE